MSAAPRLSAILVAPEGFGPVATTVRHLAEQSIARELELVLVTTADAGTPGDELDLARFGSVRHVRVPAIPTNAAGYAEGVRAATAEIVVFCEDHSFPDRSWAEALLAAYAPGVAAVGPVVAPANRKGIVACADFLLGYGPWLDPTPSGEVDYLPGHNSSYRRSVLLEYEPDLDTWLEAESVLHWDLRPRGHRLRLEGRARTNHFNFSRAASWLAATYLQSRTFGARRMSGASPARRLLWLLATPLIPLVRLRRALGQVRQLPSAPPLWRLLPALVLALLVSVAGEAAGYARGAGAAPQRVFRYEFVRSRHMTAGDRAAMASARFWEHGP